MRIWIGALSTLLFATACKAAVTKDCAAARLEELRIVAADGSTSIDYCAPGARLTPAAAAALEQARALNSKAAELFSIPIDKLLPLPFRLLIRKSAFGPMASDALMTSSDNITTITLTLGVFNNWKGEPLNAGVYSHELGHVIADNYDNPALPPLYNELEGTALMTELVADVVAIHATGGPIVSPEPGVPGCLNEQRAVKDSLTYAAPIDDFTVLHGRARNLSCCREIERAGAHTRRSLEYCRAYHAKLAADGPAGIDSFGARLFDGPFYESNHDLAEPHELGMPFNAFLIGFARETGIDAGRRLIEAMWKASLAPRRHYACTVPRLANLLREVSEDSWSAAAVLDSFAEGLSAGERAAFDRQYHAHRLDIWRGLAETDARVLAGGVALQHHSDEYNRAGESLPIARLKATGCTSEDLPNNLDADVSGCAYACRPAQL